MSRLRRQGDKMSKQARLGDIVSASGLKAVRCPPAAGCWPNQLGDPPALPGRVRLRARLVGGVEVPSEST